MALTASLPAHVRHSVLSPGPVRSNPSAIQVITPHNAPPSGF